MAFFFILLAVFCFSPCFAQEKTEPRTILALFETTPHPDPADSTIHLAAEMPLNHLGLKVRYHALDKPLPQDMRDVRGILTWFLTSNAVKDPVAYCNWLSSQMDQGRYVVILEEPGVFADQKRVMPEACQAMFGNMGLSYQGEFADNPYFFELASKDAQMMEMEKPLDLSDSVMSQYKLTSPQGKKYLTLKRTDLNDSEADLVVVTPKGGFAHRSFVRRLAENGKAAWLLNPFLFFNEAFRAQDLPRGDPTTSHGRRVLLSRIDGDGIFNISNIDRKSFSGEVILNSVLKKYPDLPVTVSLITGYFDMPEYQSKRVDDLYKSLFTLPNVEAASHGYAHPLIWTKKTLALHPKGYEFSAKEEIVDSVSLVNRLLHRLGIDKTTSLFLWTGDGKPDAETLALLKPARLLNMNGGGGRMDGRYKTVSFLYPFGIEKDGALQVYAGAYNENDYTNLWHGPYYGYREYRETIDNAEEPRRLKPVDIYYHFYSGEYQASLHAVTGLYDYAKTLKLFPLFSSEYSKSVEGFYSLEYARLPDGGFKLSGNGDLKTVRFDDVEGEVDLRRSAGVIGYKHKGSALYIHLDDSESHEIRFSHQPQEGPYLTDSSFHVKNLKGDRDRFEFSKKGWGKSEGVFGGLRPLKTYRVVTGSETKTVTADEKGLLNLSFDSSEGSGPPVKVEVSL